MFSRHIAKTVKSIQHVLFELQEFYNFNIEMDLNYNNIIVRINMPQNSEKNTIDFAGKDLKHNLSPLWNWQYTDFQKKNITLCLKSII
jgi:hypothetical protein